jgi:hypothetical protein
MVTSAKSALPDGFAEQINAPVFGDHIIDV